jgi:benzoylsuccinyl-CoA thiolase BbsB subunit
MTDVFVVSGRMIKFGKYPQSSYAGLASGPAFSAVKDAGLQMSAVDAVYCGSSFGGMLTGQRIAKVIGIRGVPVVNVENACSGGATAVHEAYESIRSGRHDVVLAIGVDKLSQFGGGTLPLVQEDHEVQLGMVMPAMYGMRAQRFLHERDALPEDLANVAVKAHAHGALNPFAQYRGQVTTEEVLSSRPIADPLTLLQCCPTGDGAAAVLLVSDRVRREHGLDGVQVAASVLHSGQVSYGYRDMLAPEITRESAREAFDDAGIQPQDLDLVELHDAFSIAELVYYEALGLCAPGESVKLLRSGGTALGGHVVVNPSGGLLSKGHPVGASGVAQVVEVFWQLLGRAGGRQVPGARVALTHVTGGGIAGLDHGACAVHVFKRV